MPLSKTQKAILDYLVEYIGEHGYSPTYDEIARRFGYRSLSTAYGHVRSLADKGVVRVTNQQQRSIEVLRMDDRERRVPAVLPPRSWLRERVDDYPTVPVAAGMELPLSSERRFREAWRDVRSRATPGDEIWTFATPEEIWRESAGRAGYAVVRGGEVVDGVLVWDEISEDAQPAKEN
jgi:repressor LexA